MTSLEGNKSLCMVQQNYEQLFPFMLPPKWSINILRKCRVSCWGESDHAEKKSLLKLTHGMFA